MLIIVLVASLPASARAEHVEGPLERATPRRAVASFLEAEQAGDDARAAELLDLRQVPPSQRGTRGPELARMLYEVLDRTLVLEPAQLSDEPAGRPEDGVNAERIGVVRLNGTDVPITLARVQSGAETSWVFSAATVARIPKLHDEFGAGWLETRVPGALRSRIGALETWQWLGLALALFVAVVVGRFAAWVGWRIGSRIAAKTTPRWDDELVESLRSPARVGFALLAFRALLEPLGLSALSTTVIARIVSSLTIIVSAWVVIRVVAVLSRIVERRAVETAKGAASLEMRSRGLTTQVRVLRRVVNVSIGIFAAALVLLQFDVVRNVGLSLLASAGLAGVVLGFAAQRTIGSLIAGIQLSATQPIRIGDVVVVEKEWGTIEEITLTFVVVKVWDERRLIVPMTRFLEQPFENWTKVAAELHGTVFLHVDWTLPIDELRAEVDRVVTDHPCWDKRTKSVVVTDSKERTLEVRVLVSASNAGDLWNLRVHVREALVAWLRDHEGGKYLPKSRVDDRAAARALA